jgi:hypothetical protein
MNEKIASFLRFAGFGRKAKDLSDQEIVELYKRVKEQLAETSGEENPVLDSSSPGPAPMEDSELDLDGTPSTPISDGTDIGSDEPAEEAPVEQAPTEEPPAENPLGSTDHAEEDPNQAPAEEGAYDPEQDQDLQAMLDELGLGDDEIDQPATGETGDASDASGAPGPIEQEQDSIQVNSSEEPEELSTEELKKMFGVIPADQPEEQAPIEAPAQACVATEEPAQEPAPANKDVMAEFLTKIDAIPFEGEQKPEGEPVEEKTATVDPTQEPMSDIADEFEVLSQDAPVEGDVQNFSSQTPDNLPQEQPVMKTVEPSPSPSVTVQDFDNKEVDISDFTIAGKGRLASKGFQLVRKDKDTMADGITRPDADKGEGVKPERTDLQNPFGADFKKKSENRDVDVDSDKDLKIASIAERIAYEFDTKEALDKYLDEHPKADKNNHWVDETQERPSSPAQQPVPQATRNKAQNDAYKTLGDSIKGFFRDTDWSGARSVFKKLQAGGFKIDHLGVDDSGYKTEGGYKRWRANLLHPSGRELNCTVTAHSAGEISDPYGRYDLSVVIQ